MLKLDSLSGETSYLQTVILYMNEEGEKWANYNGANFFLISSNWGCPVESFAAVFALSINMLLEVDEQQRMNSAHSNVCMKS